MVTPIRCSTIKKRGQYDLCGSLIGGIGDDGSIYFHCPTCPKWWKISFDDSSGMIMKELPKGTKFDFTDTIKVVE